MRIKVLKFGGCKDIASKFQCSVQCVSLALNFKQNSMKARRIRHYAMNELASIIL